MMTAEIPSTKPTLKIYTIPFEKLSISFTLLITVLKMSNSLKFLKTDLNILLNFQSEKPFEIVPPKIYTQKGELIY